MSPKRSGPLPPLPLPVLPNAPRCGGAAAPPGRRWLEGGVGWLKKVRSLGLGELCLMKGCQPTDARRSWTAKHVYLLSLFS